MAARLRGAVSRVVFGRVAPKAALGTAPPGAAGTARRVPPSTPALGVTMGERNRTSRFGRPRTQGHWGGKAILLEPRARPFPASTRPRGFLTMAPELAQPGCPKAATQAAAAVAACLPASEIIHRKCCSVAANFR